MTDRDYNDPKPRKRRKSKKVNERYQYVDVRFAKGQIDRVYTYKVRKGAKVHLGQTLVVENEYGTTCVFVVGINTKRWTNVGDVMKEITLKVTKL